MRKAALLTLALAGLASCSPAPETTLTGSVSGSVVKDDATYIVVLRDDVRDVPGVARGLVNQAGGRLERTYESALRGFAAQLPAAAINGIRNNPNVRIVEVDSKVTGSGIQNSAPWNLDRIDQSALPLDTKYTYGGTGSGVTAYILDSGIRSSHSEFGGRASGVFTSIQDGNGTGDCNGHGTHVAGTVGGATSGVAKDVQLRAVRVLDCTGTGMVSGIIAGVDWITANGVKPAVVNASLSSAGSASFDLAVQNSIAAGFTYTVAAGNGTTDACTISPARVPGVLTVGATTPTDSRWSSSNFGTCVDLFAPGNLIVSASSIGDNDFKSMSGTSMAAPHVAGAAALYLQTHPSAAPSEVMSAVIGSSATNRLTDIGTGSPNRLLQISTSTPVNTAPIANFTVSCIELTCSVNGSSSSDDSQISQYTWSMPGGTPSSASGVTSSVTYLSEGTKSITLTVTDNTGLTGSVTKSVTVTAPVVTIPPVANFTWTCVAASHSCTFDGRSSTDDGQLVNWYWDFGNKPRMTASGSLVTASFQKSGVRVVTLTVTDDRGLVSSIAKSVTVP